jgi:hypothetical protein
LPQYEASKPMIPRSNHRREVVPVAVVEGDPEKIVKQEVRS